MLRLFINGEMFCFLFYSLFQRKDFWENLWVLKQVCLINNRIRCTCWYSRLGLRHTLYRRQQGQTQQQMMMAKIKIRIPTPIPMKGASLVGPLLKKLWRTDISNNYRKQCAISQFVELFVLFWWLNECKVGGLSFVSYMKREYCSRLHLVQGLNVWRWRLDL